MNSNINFVFSKAFFSEILCVSIRKISFVMIRYKDEEDDINRIGIKVDGVNNFLFDIETGNFIRLSPNHFWIPAKVVKRGNFVVFSTDNSRVEYGLDSFYGHYCKYVANSLIRDDNPHSIIPTIRKNKWKSGCRPILDLEFNKFFWSRLLHVDVKDISYSILMVKYFEQDTPDNVVIIKKVPVLKIKGISKYYYSIDLGKFFKPEEVNDEIIHIPWCGPIVTEAFAAKVGFSKNEVSFSAQNGEKLKVWLASIYRHYITRIVNSLIVS